MENYGNDVYLSMVSWNNTNFIKNETQRKMNPKNNL